MFYLNTNAQFILFQQALNSDIYVDKSMLISQISKKIHTEDRYICITRPRRFGKTMNANMLGAYYTRGTASDGLFDHLMIAQTENYHKDMNQYNVIHVDFSVQPDSCSSYQEYITSIRKKLKKNFYPPLS